VGERNIIKLFENDPLFQLKDDDKIVGFVAVTDEKDCVVIDTIHVEKRRRGEGIGSQLIQEVINYASQSGKNIAGEFKPEEIINSERVLNFYKKHGFTIDNEGKLKR
jgi:ribosomal protein S18 acetylase RimI-like enzyme